jgi:hypothetical protein
MIDNVKLIESSCWVLILRKCQVLEIFDLHLQKFYSLDLALFIL